MRFIENGPSIPDELLTARDEGRVVFFCGAGVSLAYAGLPDFFGLADKVIKTLGVSTNDPVCKLLNEAREIDRRIGVSGLISADRIFGLLERDFPTNDIEAAVAKALTPSSDVDLSAHRALLDIATTPAGKVRLVTTNFDRLFNDCDPRIKYLQPPRLPQISREEEFDGVVYLHGLVTEDYSGSEGDGFTLTSSGFGKAYLAEGWATEFFREILEKYVVVFVGYSADDPPIQYLLEGLSRRIGNEKNIYAFQMGSEDEATARWRHKGIEAIAYPEDNNHLMLWKTLELWANRARDSDAWFQSLIDMAAGAPEKLAPYQRGQIAHMVSTTVGAQKFSVSEVTPSADWLCVFDPFIRYSKPSTVGMQSEDRYWVDPFELYGLDSDTIPQKISPDDHYAKRDRPADAWNAFSVNRLDYLDSQEKVRLGHSPFSSSAPTELPSRLSHIGTWFARVADQPATVWWTARRHDLHPEIQRKVKWRLRTTEQEISPSIRRAWRYLFESWAQPRVDFHASLYEFKSLIVKEGWDRSFAEKYSAIISPYLKVGSEYWNGVKPPPLNTNLNIKDLLHLDVEYPSNQNHSEVPNAWVSEVVTAIRRNLEHAFYLESELGGYGLHISASIVEKNDEAHNEAYEHSHGLSGYLLSFFRLFERLILIDIHAAREEVRNWPSNDETIFCRLKIWAASNEELLSHDDFYLLVKNLSDKAFWDSYHSPDFLTILANRWNNLSSSKRKKIEARLLRGPSKWLDEESHKFKERKAWSVLNRITWMAKCGCNFSFDIASKSEKLKSLLPQWEEKYADKVVESMTSRGGMVRTETEHSALLLLPLSNILATAASLNGRTEDFLVENNPFAGLSKERPFRAFMALVDAAKRNDHPEWAWRTFLQSEERANDRSKFTALIAERIARLPNAVLNTLLHPASDWISKIAKRLAKDFPLSFDQVISKLISALQLQPSMGGSRLVRGNDKPDWTMEAINSPVGKVTQALVEVPRLNTLTANEGLPITWSKHADALLALEGDQRRYALVIFSHQLTWLYFIDSNWTISRIVIALELDIGDEADAIWSGFLWAARTPNIELYQRLKPALLLLIKDRFISRRGYTESLSGMILAGWAKNPQTGLQLISDNEMREALLQTDEEFRSRILWQVKIWSQPSEDVSNIWPNLLVEFLESVWPRQKAVKTAKISANLVEIAFSNSERFAEIVPIVLPLCTVIDNEFISLPYLAKEKEVIQIYPQHTLRLIYAVLPDNVLRWPYGIDEILSKIIESDPKLKTDPKYVELNRKWNSRQ